MVQPALDTTQDFADRLPVALFVFLSCMDDDQLCDLFISAWRAEGDDSVAVSER
jgi:hypothetical protein